MENETIEETQETATDAEQVETQEDSQEETKDWKAEALKYKAIAERKDKKLQETETKPLKTNTDTDSLSREEGILIAKGMETDELDYLNLIKGDRSREEAMESDDFKNWQAGKKAAKTNENAQLGASGSSPVNVQKKEKTTGKMTEEEHKAFFNKRVNG